MNLSSRFDSASGLKPTTAFVLVAGVLGLIGLKAAKISFWDEGDQPPNLMQQRVPDVTFDILDANGTPLALSVERLELVMSPNATWQAHTPDRMAAALARALGPGYSAERLLEMMLPDAVRGTISVPPETLCLDAAQATAVHRWIRTGSTREDAEARPIRGVRIERNGRTGTYTLAWSPVLLLSERTRAEQGVTKPLDWSRRIADDLYACLHGAPIRDALGTDEEIAGARARIWGALMPSRFKCLVKEVPPQSALAVWKLLGRERVRAHQMDLQRLGRRAYPGRSENDRLADPPLAVLGSWGTYEPAEASRVARKKLGLPDSEAMTAEELDLLRRETARLVYEPTPKGGIELLGQALLARPEWADLERRAERYTYLANQPPRQPLQRYFRELEPAGETPHIVTTLEMELQREMRRQLELVMEKHRPALVMAIAVEVATGKVLAVDAIDPYGIGGFLPTIHTFTPGSTMKVVVMASALEAGVVRPEDEFNTFNGRFRLGGHAIGEAENSKTGWITAAEGLAYSCNAVLVQIGIQVPDAVMHGHFLGLGYSQRPGSGLGPERTGYVSPLPWTKNWTHASVSFGHEMSVTLWQHAAALATVARGGEYRPLAVVDAVEQGGVRRSLPLAPPRRVFSSETCALVREMMAMGAREGTGRKVYCPYLEMGTKTGTAQKVGSEVCLHVELQHNRDHGCRGARACRKSLVRAPRDHGTCYTSSMCAYGRVPGTEREVMVLVVADEPRGSKKYGSDVAGPAAAAILEEALLTRRDGVRPPALSPEGFTQLVLVEPGSPHKTKSQGAGTASRSKRSRETFQLPWEEARLATR
ncbi:MAG: penicillin-binding transpeptidase domain-containing protein [Planctomycetota bacterium]